MLALRKLINKPKLTDSHPLSVFYYCDEAVNHQMRELNYLMKTTPDNLDRRATLIKQLKEAQHNLMNVIFAITQDAVPEHHTCRDFRAKYPDDVIVDQINGPLWFGAECIAAGSHILNHELESEQLRPFALQLSKAISRVRVAIKEQCLTNRQTYTQKLKDMLQEFDVMWADFEFRYVGLMCNVKSERQYYHQQDVIVLFCESTLRALKRDYISHDMIEMMDPSIMFAIPRLAIVCGLLIYPDGPLNPSRPTKELPPFFRGYQQLLARIKELLGYLTEEQLITLEKALCSSEGLGSLNFHPPKNQQFEKTAAPRPLSDVTNSSLLLTSESSPPSSPSPSAPSPSHSLPSQSSPATPDPQRRDALPRTSFSHQRSRSLDLTTQVLETREQVGLDLVSHPLNSYVAVTAAMSTQETASEGSTAMSSDLPGFELNESTGPAVMEREDESFPQFEPSHPVVNDLPMATPSIIPGPLVAQEKHTPPSSGVSPTTPRKQSRKSGRRSSQRSKGPAGFASADDLMHRLFVAISGVADQLQTNHAKDLRVILKHVFAVCQSDPEPLETDTAGDKMDDRESGHEFMMESSPISPLSAAEGLGLTPSISLSHLSSSQNWVPDRECLNCAACNETFSWKKRRHHCRSCGQVVCSRCSPNSLPLPASEGGRRGWGQMSMVRVCTSCYLHQLGVAVRVSATNHTSSPVHALEVL